MNIIKNGLFKSFYRGLVCILGLFSLCLSCFFFIKDSLDPDTLGAGLIKSSFFGVSLSSSDVPLSSSPYILEGAREGEVLLSLNETENEKQYITEMNVISADLSGSPEDKVLIKNETSYYIDTESIPVGETVGKKKVLIIHTHATESYLPEGTEFYDPSIPTRTDDTESNVVAVGEVIAEYLNEAGIETVHCRTLHDGASYNDAYTNSLKSVKEYLKYDPQIKYVFDIHRDAIIRSDGTSVKPISEGVAQIMLLCGTDEGGGNFPHWRENAAFAFALQKKLNALHKNVARPVLIRGATYHQQYAERFLLVEIGAFGNTLEEAKKAGEIFAKALVSLITEEAEE